MLFYASVETETEFYPVGIFCRKSEEIAALVRHPSFRGMTDVVNFQVTGETYEARKDCLLRQAETWEAADLGCVADRDIEDAGKWFSKMGKRYGLLREFREMCIID